MILLVLLVEYLVEFTNCLLKAVAICSVETQILLSNFIVLLGSCFDFLLDKLLIVFHKILVFCL